MKLLFVFTILLVLFLLISIAGYQFGAIEYRKDYVAQQDDLSGHVFAQGSCKHTGIFIHYPIQFEIKISEACEETV